jgi:hypothetical protein
MMQASARVFCCRFYFWYFTSFSSGSDKFFYCLQSPGEGYVDSAANDFENALIICGQLQQSELDQTLCPIRSSVPRLTVVPRLSLTVFL